MPEEMCNSIDETMTYKGFLIIIVPIALLFSSLMGVFFYTVSGTQSDNLKDALTEQRAQLRLIVETHSETPHRGVPTSEQLIAIEARQDRQNQVFMAGMKENSEAVREIAALSLTNVDNGNKRSKAISYLMKSVKRINMRLGLK